MSKPTKKQSTKPFIKSRSGCKCNWNDIPEARGFCLWCGKERIVKRKYTGVKEWDAEPLF